MKKEAVTIVSNNTKNPERQIELVNGIAKIMGDKPHTIIFPEDDQQAVVSMRNAEILLTWRFTEEMLNAATKLKWVHASGAGIEKFLFPKFRDSKILFTNTRGIHGIPMAEWVVGALTYFSQSLACAEKWKSSRDWSSNKEFMTRNSFILEGKTALIVGYGEVGKVIEKKLSALGINCEGVVSSIRPAKVPLHTLQTVSEIIGKFDIVIVALPLTKETEGLFAQELFSKMKANSIFLNVARGKIVQESDLIEALRNGGIAFAALDVFQEEPLPENSPLFEVHNILMTPHISGNFPEYTSMVIKAFLRNLEKYLSGLPMEYVVDKQKGY